MNLQKYVLLLVLLSHLSDASEWITYGSLKDKVRNADFIFEGSVVDMQYRFAKPDVTGSNSEFQVVPYTFVTYKIDRIHKGKTARSVVTLRFLGGPIDDDNMMLVDSTPLFDVGERDLLLVRNDRDFICPLVGCSEGRFRFINGLVVNDSGQRIHFSKSGEILYGEMIQSDEIDTHIMSSISLKRENPGLRKENEAPSAPDFPHKSSILPDDTAFSQHIDDAVQRYHTYEELEQLPEFESADPDGPVEDTLAALRNSKPGNNNMPVPEEIEEIDQHELLERQLEAEYYGALDEGKSEKVLEKLLSDSRIRLGYDAATKEKADSVSNVNYDMQKADSAVAKADTRDKISNKWVIWATLLLILFFVGVNVSRRYSRS